MNKEVSVDFSEGEISSDGAVVLLEKLEKKHDVIDYISQHIPDHQDLLQTFTKEGGT